VEEKLIVDIMWNLVEVDKMILVEEEERSDYKVLEEVISEEEVN
jgi:hypothetical protein